MKKVLGFWWLALALAVGPALIWQGQERKHSKSELGEILPVLIIECRDSFGMSPLDTETLSHSYVRGVTSSASCVAQTGLLS